jgi:hypothetical protein
MNKEIIATILGVAGLSLLKKVSGSSNDPVDLPEKLGFLWFKVKVIDKDDSGYDLYDFISITADLMYFSKKYETTGTWQILEDNGIEFDEDDDPIYPEGEVQAVRDVLESNFGSYSYSVDEIFAPVYQIDSRVFRKLINNGVIFSEIKEISDDEFYVQADLSKVDDASKLSAILSDLENRLDTVRHIFEHYMYELGEDVEVSVSVSPVSPKDPRVLNALFRGDSEIRKF